MLSKNYRRLRRISQLFFVLLLLLSPISQIVRTFQQDPQPYKDSLLLRNNFIREFLLENNLMIKEIWSTFYDNISGGAYSIQLFSIKIVEPMTSFLLLVRNSFNFDFWNWTAIISISIPLLFVILFGRIYCSFICPWSMISNLSLKIHKKLFNKYPKFSASVSQKYLPIWKKYYILILGALLLFNPVLIQYILPPAIIQNGWSDFILFGDIALWLIIFFSLLIFEIITPTFFCKMLCPTGIFLSILGKLRIFQLGYIKKNKCDKDCVLCNENCWLGIDPKINAKDSACDLCARCIKVCPTNRLTIKKKNKYIVNSFLVILALSFSACNQNDRIIEYGDSLIDITVLENRDTQITKSNDTLNIRYSVFMSELTEFNDGLAHFTLHINSNYEEVFSSPIEISIVNTEDGSLLNKETIQKPNFPLSVLKQSSYHQEFQFERNKAYKITASSPSNKFEALTIKFCHPKKRF